MMTKGIPTQASGLLFQVADANHLAKGTRENNFDMFLDKSIKRETEITVRAKEGNDNTKNSSLNRKQATDGKDKNINIMDDKKDIRSDIGNKEAQTVDNISDDSQDPAELTSSDLLGQILSMIGQIRNAIMEELNMTAEEIDSIMKELGLELADLTDPKAIRTLLLANKGLADPFEMLMDEQLGYSFQDLLAKVEDIKDEADLKLSDDEISRILKQSVETDETISDTDEIDITQPQLLSGKAEEVKDEAGDKAVKLQGIGEDGEASSQRSVIATNGNSESKDTKDSNEKTDRTDGFEVFLDKLSANYDKPIVEFDSNNTRLYEIREIAQQIVDQIRVAISPEKTSMELQLNPEHLGKVNLTISSKAGVMSAHFSVQNELAKEAIEGQLITLKDTLAQQGIKVETIEVTVASYTFDQNSSSNNPEQMMQKKQRTGHKITFEEAVAMIDEPIEDVDNTNLTGTMGHTINYRA
ncbi:MAG: flagellar hook-length control protein FliK [Clostridiales bacterium]|nr:flagellar hook-length control protein FliK [Clostridiales bacterium]